MLLPITRGPLMEFANIWVLVLLIFPLLLRYRSGGAALRLPGVVVGQGRSRRVWWAEKGGRWLRRLGLASLILAWAGPRWPDASQPQATEGIAIGLVVDVSASMATEDFPWDGNKISRFEAVRRVFRRFVLGGETSGEKSFTGRPHDLMMLIVFAARPETVCPLTLDHRALVQILDQEKPRRNILEATTNPGEGLAWALQALDQAPSRRKILVFLTDGESNVPGKMTPRQAAQLAGNLQVPIYAIDAASDEEADADKAHQTLQDLARMTQGDYFRANDQRALVRALEKIDRLERDPLPQPGTYYELYRWFALAGVACWLLVLVLEATLWRRLP